MAGFSDITFLTSGSIDNSYDSMLTGAGVSLYYQQAISEGYISSTGSVSRPKVVFYTDATAYLAATEQLMTNPDGSYKYNGYMSKNGPSDAYSIFIRPGMSPEACPTRADACYPPRHECWYRKPSYPRILYPSDGIFRNAPDFWRTL